MLFIIMGSLLLIGLTLTKMNQPTDHFVEPSEMSVPKVRISLATVEVPSDTGPVYISTKPISKELFRQFAAATSYKSWAESQGLDHSWKSGQQQEAEWVTPDDAEAFCTWLGQVQDLPYGSHYRLPTVDELELLAPDKSDSLYWTSQTLADFEKGSSTYKTAWKADGTLFHRRIRDLVDPDVPPIGFYVVLSKAPA